MPETSKNYSWKKAGEGEKVSLRAEQSQQRAAKELMSAHLLLHSAVCALTANTTYDGGTVRNMELITVISKTTRKCSRASTISNMELCLQIVIEKHNSNEPSPVLVP